MTCVTTPVRSHKAVRPNFRQLSFEAVATQNFTNSQSDYESRGEYQLCYCMVFYVQIQNRGKQMIKGDKVVQ